MHRAFLVRVVVRDDSPDRSLPIDNVREVLQLVKHGLEMNHLEIVGDIYVSRRWMDDQKDAERVGHK
jgi:hypothetical protein